MFEDKDSLPGPESKKPKKGLAIDSFLEPVAEVKTLIGQLYLFPLRVSDIGRYERISTGDPVARIRSFLPCIASLSPEYSLEQERVAITVEQVGQLSDDEVEALAESYASSSVFVGEAKEREPLSRSQGETSSSFLDRLLRREIKEQASQNRKLYEQAFGSTRGIFDQVRKSSLELGKSREIFDRLLKATEIPAFEAKSFETHDHFAELRKKIDSERVEDREIIRLTGRMTEQSAKTLQDLAEAASTLLEKLDERDVESKRTTRNQLLIAVFAVGISALLACASFVQDRVNNASSDHWQAVLLSEVKASNQRRNDMEDEAKRLREEVRDLKHQVFELDNQLRVAKDTKPVPVAAHPKP